MEEELERLRKENEMLKEKEAKRKEKLREYANRPSCKEKNRERARRFYEINKERILRKRREKYAERKRNTNID